ncbi:MAG: nitroreductase family protein [Anaerotignaceae bacterium]
METYFKVNKEKCTKCQNCINTCSGMVLESDKNGYPIIKKFERYGWRGCWKCQHCLAVCPQGAISIFNKIPENSMATPPKEMGNYMEQLITNRRSCRRYLDKNVDPEIITKILNTMAAVPTGGNSCNVEYTVIDDKERVKKIWKIAYSKMEDCAKKQIYTSSFSNFYYTKMKQSEKTVRKDDLLFCGAPHLFIAHEKCQGKWAEDSKVNCNIATTYFELLANAFGLGTIIMSYPADVLVELAPEAEKLIGIPNNHYRKLIVGFGYPEIKYSRGVQKDRNTKTHRYTAKKI